MCFSVRETCLKFSFSIFNFAQKNEREKRNVKEEEDEGRSAYKMEKRERVREAKIN